MISQATYRLSSQPPLQGIVVGSPGGPKALGPEDVKLALKLLPGTCCFCSPVFVGLDPPQNKVLFPIKTRSFGFQVHQPRGTHANIKIATQKKKMVGRLERQAFPFGKSAMIDFWGGNLLLKKTKKVGAVSGGCHCAGRGLTTNYPHNIYKYIYPLRSTFYN